MQGFVGGIGHDETKRLFMYRQFASSTNFMCLAYKIPVIFQRFPNGLNVSQRNTASEIYSEFIYVEGSEVLVSVYFVK